MTWSAAEQRWEQIRELVRENWNGLTEPDLDWVSGSRDRLHSCICRVYGISCRLADVQISNFETLNAEAFLMPGRKCLSKRICLHFSMSRLL